MVIRLWLAKGQLAPEDLGAQQGKNPQKQEKQDEKGDNGLDTVDEWGKEVLQTPPVPRNEFKEVFDRSSLRLELKSSSIWHPLYCSIHMRSSFFPQT